MSQKAPRRRNENLYYVQLVSFLMQKKCASSSFQVKIWFQNRRARERRDKEGGQEIQDVSNSQQTKFSLHGAKSVKETFLSKGTNQLPTFDHMRQESFRLKGYPEATDATPPILKSSRQMTPNVTSYLLHGLLPSQLPWLRPTENPFLSQRTLSLFNR